MLELDHVSKRLGSFQLRNITLQIPTGYLCGLAGENGAGKTSLLHMLLGLYRPDSGTVRIDGKIYEENEKEIRQQAGIVLAEDLLHPAFSLLQNGRYYGSFYNGYEEACFVEKLKQYHLDPREKFGHLSKGQKLKCQFAFALACHPAYLFLDEPVANFDPEFKKQFFADLCAFIGDGERTAVLSTHETEDLDRLADYLIFMKEGEAVIASDMEKFRDSYRIVSGEAYKIRLLRPDAIVKLEEREFGARALVRHSRLLSYDKSLLVAYPTIADFMYFMS